MTVFLTAAQVILLHAEAIEQHGGALGIRDNGGLKSAVAQPKATFGGQDLYPSILDKAAALAYSLVANHPFLDGNKRAGHAAMHIFLRLNGYEITATTDEQERIFLQVASGEMDRAHLADWLATHHVQIILPET